MAKAYVEMDGIDLTLDEYEQLQRYEGDISDIIDGYHTPWRNMHEYLKQKNLDLGFPGPNGEQL